MTCRYDSKAEAHLRSDGSPCLRDDYGDPTTHCRARRRCNAHIGRGDLTCHACIERVRRRLARIGDLVALMPAAALEVGRVDSDAMTLAGVAADPVVTSWRRINAAREGGVLIGDDEDEDPTATLGRWQQMLSEDYGHDLPDRVTLATALAYLGRVLARVAQDPEQEFPLLLGEVSGVRQRLERVLSMAPVPRRGVPCPWCTEDGVPPERMVWREGSVEADDVWRCPTDHDHWMRSEEHDTWRVERLAPPA